MIIIFMFAIIGKISGPGAFFTVQFVVQAESWGGNNLY